ncbi:unnamed protein product [Schistosoma rodhaini]|uniref:WH2 domain-containing protein n=1 Tax=Schistosoma rodhaini TaxID=6188 RepID=A0AA85GGB0_9TREM|nr:unnamed protein product [Schistosoma rodhaini]
MSVPPPPPPPQIKSTRPPPKQTCDSSGPAFLADIKAGRTLRKVPDSEKKDRSAPLRSKPTDQNNEGSAGGPPAPVSGNLPPVDLSNLFANGVPKLKSVSSADVARNNTVQNLSTKPSSYGHVKSPAPPPPPPLFTTTAASVAPNNYPLSTPYTLYQHSTPTANNNATAVRNGSSVPAPPAPPPPPTPARPSISKSSSISSSNNNNNSYLRHSFHKKSSENNQPMPPVVQSPPVQVIMLSSIPTSSATPSSPPPPRVTPLQLGSIATVHENNINDMNSNSTVNNLNGTTAMPPPPSGRSPRRKQSSSNRYQRAGSTNADVNGIPVGQSTKVIRISSNINGSLPDPPSTPSSIVNPYLPSSVYDMNNYTVNSRAHPTPPPPPPPPPQQLSSLSSMNNYNDDNNNIASLVRRFESRFTFPDIGSVPVPKSYYGPKTYRVGSINSSVNNSNNLNDNYRNQVPYRLAPAAPRNY